MVNIDLVISVGVILGVLILISSILLFIDCKFRKKSVKGLRLEELGKIDRI